jgi:hypothetical protein
MHTHKKTLILQYSKFINFLITFFIVAPCILKSIQFTHQQKHYLLNLERFKIYVKIHKKYPSYMFRSTIIIRQLVLNLTKVTERSVCCAQHTLRSMTRCHITK